MQIYFSAKAFHLDPYIFRNQLELLIADIKELSSFQSAIFAIQYKKDRPDPSSSILAIPSELFMVIYISIIPHWPGAIHFRDHLIESYEKIA